jgi:glutamyl-tRNA synthetase
MDNSIIETLRNIALTNRDKHGSANPGSVLGQALGGHPELKKDVKTLREHIARITKEVNDLSDTEFSTLFDKVPKGPVKEKKKKEMKPLANVKGKIVMRFAPSASGPMHIGHAYSLGVSAMYTESMDSHFILRIEDTNPENIDPTAYAMLEEGGRWLTRIDEVIIQSDRLGVYYDYAEKLVRLGGGYVCTCTSDDFRAIAFKKIACPCRDLGVEEHQKRYAAMFSTYKPGEAVLRCRSEINHPNPALRDFPLMRINENPHARQGTEHRVWPLMNLAVVCDDIESGMTHIIRAKDHVDNAKRQEYLYNYFEKPIPETMFVGKINFTDMKVKTSLIRLEIENGKYSGWNDVRLPFLAALKRRGYQPGAFMKYAKEVGVSSTDKKVTKKDFFKTLDAFNRDIIDPTARRYFFIENPVLIKIPELTPREVELEKHPNQPLFGIRRFNVTEDFLIEKKDLERAGNGIHRLMDCLNFKKDGDHITFDSFKYEVYKENGKHIMHWLVAGDTIPVRILMPDGEVKEGLGESGLAGMKQGEIIQFERFGFCRYDGNDGEKMVFCYGHR